MPWVTLEPLRWRDQPAQAAVSVAGAQPRVRYQATSPRDVAAMCRRRPAEELPRILSILSPAHHLCAAELLDRLFAVEPPPVARATREALRLSLVLRSHLRKLFFLLSSAEDPFAESSPARRSARSLRPVLEDVASHLALAQEAAALLGGRADHPVTAVAGGVTRALRPEHHARLGEIAAACRSFAERLAGFARERILPEGGMVDEVRALGPGQMATLAQAGGALVLRDGCGAEVERFAPSALLDKVTLRREPWSHEPLAFLAAKGWRGFDDAAVESLFAVGPLARLAAGEPLATPLAEAERQRLLGALGPQPRLDVVAAWWALVTEVLGAAEALAALSDPEKLTGPALRTIPAAPGREAHAAIEGPEGLAWQHVRVDERGLVEEVRVLDGATANNGLFGLVAQRAVEGALAQGNAWGEAKRRVELALLPY